MQLAYLANTDPRLHASSIVGRFSASYRRTAAPITPIAIIPLMPAVTIGARPELVALACAALADDMAELSALEADDSADPTAEETELSAALSELRREESLALSVAAWDMRIEDAAGQSLFVVTDATKEPRTAPREVA